MTAAQLKASILQLAVTGKLVPQDPAEGTGTELLEQIVRAKSAKIPKGGPRSRAAKPAARSGASGLSGLSGISGDSGFSGTSGTSGTSGLSTDAPFEIPASWVWCKLGTICDGFQYGTASKSSKEGAVPVLRMGNLQNGEIDFSNLAYTSNEEEIQQYSLSPGDLLFNRTNSSDKVGKVSIFRSSRQCIFAGYLVRFRPLFCDSDYVNFVMNSEYQKEFCQSVKCDAIGQSNISASKFAQFLFPLPPLAEQKRIVARIEELMPLVEEYGKLEEKRLQLDADLPGALEKAILQDAIQGKLVPQDPAEGTGEELLRELFAAKNAKGAKKESRAKSAKAARSSTAPSVPCPVSDPPFEIPASWAWCKLGDVCDYGKCQSATNIPESAWVLDLEDIEKDSGRLLRRVCAKERNSKSGKHAFRKGMVLYSKLRTYLNKVLVADEDGFCTSEIIPLDFGEVADSQYARFVLMSPYFLEYTAQCGYGVKMPRLGTEDGRKALIPLPPLAEQKRIVAKVEQLLAAVRKLKTEAAG